MLENVCPWPGFLEVLKCNSGGVRINNDPPISNFCKYSPLIARIIAGAPQNRVIGLPRI